MINGNRTKSNRGRSPRDFYETPIELARAALLAMHEDERVLSFVAKSWLDAGCGAGVWGNALIDSWAKINKVETMPTLVGVDVAPNIKISESPYFMITTGNFLSYGEEDYDIVFGNPPYSLAEEFVNHAYNLIELNGYIFFLLRLSFLEGIKRGRGLFKDIPLKRLYVCSRRPSFFSIDGKHTTDTLSYGMFLWQKGYRGQPTISFLDWEYEHGK